MGNDTRDDTPDITPDEARRLLRELAEVTSRPAPLEPCPFSLTPPKTKPARTPRAERLF